MNFFEKFFSPEGFMPHAHCYLWETRVMWLHIISDGLIALAYLTIPVTLIYIARKRKDLPSIGCSPASASSSSPAAPPTRWKFGTSGFRFTGLPER